MLYKDQCITPTDVATTIRVVDKLSESVKPGLKNSFKTVLNVLYKRYFEDNVHYNEKLI